MKKLCLLLLSSLALTACATAQTPGSPSLPAAAPPSIKQVTHTDLLAAAARATKNGYPARAQVWTAIDTLLTAQEAQIKACAAAIKAALPTPSAPQVAGAFDALEAAAEAVGNFSGIPAAVKLNCLALPLPPMPVLPAIPKL